MCLRKRPNENTKRKKKRRFAFCIAAVGSGCLFKLDLSIVVIEQVYGIGIFSGPFNDAARIKLVRISVPSHLVGDLPQIVIVLLAREAPWL